MRRFNIFSKKSVLASWLAFFLLLLVLYVVCVWCISGVAKDAVRENIEHSAETSLNELGADMESFVSNSEQLYRAVSVLPETPEVAGKTLDTDAGRSAFYNFRSTLSSISAYRYSGDFFIYFEDADVIVSQHSVADSRTYYNAYFRAYFDTYKEFCDTLLKKSGRTSQLTQIHGGGQNGSNSLVFSKTIQSPSFQARPKFFSVMPIDDIFENSDVLFNKKGYALTLTHNKETVFSQTNIPGFTPDVFSSSSKNTFKVNGKKYVYYSYASQNSYTVLTYAISFDEYNKPMTAYNAKMTLVLVLVLLLNIALIYMFIRKNYKPISDILHMFEIQGNHMQTAYDSIKSQIASEDYGEKVDEMTEVTQRYILLNLFHGEVVSEKDIDILFGDAHPFKYNFIVLIAWESPNEEFDLFLPDIITELVTEKCRDAGVLSKGILHSGKLFFLINSDKDDNSEFVYTFGVINDFIKLNYSIVLNIGMSRVCSDFIGISECYRQAKTAVKHTAAAHNSICRFEDIPSDVNDEEIYFYPIEYEKQILSALRASDFAHLRSILEKIYTVNEKERDLSPQTETLLFINIIGTLNRFNESTSVTSAIHSINAANFLNMIYNCNTIEEKKATLDEIISFYEETIDFEIKNSNTALIKAVKKYIKQNYQDQELNVSQAAMHFNLRQDALSRVFKKSEGIGLLEYLNELRVTKAADMLKNTDKNIADIASEVGFSNYRTFARQFQKHFEVSAQQYRDSNGPDAPDEA